MKKKDRIKKLKWERKHDAKYSPNKELNYRIHQMVNRVRKGEKGHGCAMGAIKRIRDNYPMLLTRQSGGTARKTIRVGDGK
jgi:hypothetical protein